MPTVEQHRRERERTPPSMDVEKAGEESVCRICRDEALTDAPLFAPCKCTGSIRFVHQDCLTQWLAHSGKLSCEVCKHVFHFTPIYAPNMPKNLPLFVFAKGALKSVARYLGRKLRIVVVLLTWLVLVPYTVLITWRMMFYINGGWTAIASRDILSSATMNATESPARYRSTSMLKSLQVIDSHQILHDIFEGQIITAVSVLIAISLFMLREVILDAVQALLSEERRNRFNIEFQANLNGVVAANFDLNAVNLPLVEDDMDQTLSQQQLPSLALTTVIPTLVDEMNHSTTFNDSHLSTTSSSAFVSTTLNDDSEYSSHLHLQPTSTYNSTDSNPSISLTPFQLSQESSSSSPQPPVARSSHRILNFWDQIDNNDDDKQREVKLQNDNDQTSSLLFNSNGDSNFHQSQLIDELTPDQQIYSETINKDKLKSKLTDTTSNVIQSIITPNDVWEADSSNSDSVDDNNHNSLNHSGLTLHPATQQLLLPIPPPQIVPDIMNDHPNPIENLPDNINNDHVNENLEVEPDAAPMLNGVVNVQDGDGDIDGLLEVMGFRGSLIAMLHSVAIVVGSLTSIVFVTQWIPYLIGSLVIIAHPIKWSARIFNILHAVTAPFSDRIIEYIWPAINVLMPIAILKDLATPVVNQLNNTVIHNTTMEIVDRNFTLLGLVSNVNSFLDKLDSTTLDNTWRDRIICMLIGYLLIVLCLAYYLTFARRNPYARVAKNFVLQVLKSVQRYTKIVVFTAVELIVLPVFSGLLLDLATLPLFRDVSVYTRITFIRNHGVAAVFLHWFAGTSYMSQLAVFVTVMREILRPGMLWFIRDPNEPDFSPIKEIGDKPVLLLLRKIGTAMRIYAFVILLTVGVMCYGLNIFIPGMFPLNLSFSSRRSPLMDMPIEILLFQFITPRLLVWLDLRKYVKAATTEGFFLLGRILRLSSYFFGGRHALEEGHYVGNIWNRMILLYRCMTAPRPANLVVEQANITVRPNPLLETPKYPQDHFIPDGAVYRVPVYDAVEVISGNRMIIAVDANGVVLNKELDLFRDVLEHWTYVYLPNNYKIRFYAAIVLMCIGLSSIAAVCFGASLSLGRLLFAVYLKNTTAHDLYPLSIGFCLLAGSAESGVMLARLFSWTRNNAINVTSKFTLSHVLRVISISVQYLWLGISFGVLFPMALSTLAYCYIILPLKNDATRDYVQEWVFGLLILRICYRIAELFPQNTLTASLDEAFRGGWTNINVGPVNHAVIFPVTAVVTAAYYVPSSSAQCLMALLKLLPDTIDGSPLLQLILEYLRDVSNYDHIIVNAYPVATMCGTLVVGAITSLKLLRLWVGKIKDQEYLVGRALNNLPESARTGAT